MKHVVFFSGGLGSWAAAKRVATREGIDNLILLFTDTKTEDADLYRFLHEAAADVGGELVIIADGRNVWEIFYYKRFLGNSRIDPCSRILKRELAQAWIEENFQPEEVMLYIGIDWTEIHRFERVKPRWKPYKVLAPMCEEPYLSLEEIREQLKQEGIELPRLYQLGFPHNNCGGFCVKAGHAHFRHLLKTLPDRYAYHEKMEQEFREFIGKDVAIMRDRRGGETKPLTMKTFRERQCEGNEDWGGCGCFL